MRALGEDPAHFQELLDGEYPQAADGDLRGAAQGRPEGIPGGSVTLRTRCGNRAHTPTRGSCGECRIPTFGRCGRSPTCCCRLNVISAVWKPWNGMMNKMVAPSFRAWIEHRAGKRKVGGGTGVPPVTAMARMAMPQRSALQRAAGFHDVIETKWVSLKASQHFEVSSHSNKRS